MSDTQSTYDMQHFAEILELFERSQQAINHLHDIIIRLDFDDKKSVKTYHKAMKNVSEAFGFLTESVYFYGRLDQEEEENC